MSFHPAFPSSADLARETAATDRDIADLVVLRELRQIVADALARAKGCDDLRHPDRKWSVDDLIDGLQGDLVCIDDEMQRIRRSPVVVEDED